MEPVFINAPEIKIVGLGTRFISALSPNKNNMKVIPKLWDAYLERAGEIQNVNGPASLGVVEMLPAGEAKSDPDELFYIACTEVTDFGAIPPGMVHRQIPAGRYAVFTHIGKLDRLVETMTRIYRVWLPASGLQHRNAASIEVYDERFDPFSDQSEFEIRLAV